ncbi:MAG: hypothetical protein PVF33_04380 [Candidatus Latescibacterota bacterium]|jgi:hypothetical protein
MKLQILAICLLCFLVSAATDSDELALAVADAQHANLEAMAKYTWRVKSNITLNGESKATSITEMRFNADGELEATNAGGESNIEKKRGLRGRRQAKKIEDFAEYLEGVLDQSFKYIFLTKGMMVDIFDRAKITESESSIDVSAGDLFVKGDELTMTIDPATKLTKKLTFKTTLGDDAIHGAVTLDSVENGPSKPAKLEFDIPTQNVKITSETYDWVEQK